MIRRRQLYKRIAVLSYSIEKDNYESIYNSFREERIGNHPDQHEERRKKLEQAILDICISDFNETTFYEEYGTAPIVLFDVPLKALRNPPAKESLWYVPEDKLGLREIDVFKNNPVVDSKIYMENTTFDKKVGKIRVLAHPDWESVIIPKMDSEQILQLLLST